MSNGQMSAPMVIRVGAGTVRSAGPHHSGTYHPVWAHIPGLIVCMPSTPADAKGLMKTALRAGDPIIMLEPKALFATKGEVPVGEHLVPFGVARIAREGSDLTIVSAGQLVHRSLDAAEALQELGISAEVIDLRTIQPLDVDTIVASVRKTHRLLVVDESYAMCGIGAEIAQSVAELAFDELDAPVARLHTDPLPHPFAPSLERAMVVGVDRIVDAARKLLIGKVEPPLRWGGSARSQAMAAPVAPPPVAKPKAQPPKAAPEPAVAVEGEPITMPFGDLTVSEGRLIRWARAAGERVGKGELVAEVETDKAVVEIESPCDGVLSQHLAAEGEVVKMGQQLASVKAG
jgi:2-oxoisovalerate dehydrogenase E1 component